MRREYGVWLAAAALAALLWCGCTGYQPKARKMVRRKRCE